MGGTPRRVRDRAIGARISPDGSQIAYLRLEAGRSEIWLMRAEGGEEHRVVGVAEGRQEFLSPAAWSPEGNRLAFIRTTLPVFNAADSKAQRSIEIGDVQSGRVDVALSNADLEDAFAWTSNNFLAYTVRDASLGQNSFGLWRVRLDAKTARPLGPATRFANTRGWAGNMSVTRDGKSYAVQRFERQSDVYIANIEDRGQHLSTPKRLTLDERDDFVFSWTADSKAVLFLSDRDGPIHLFRQAIDQTQPEMLVGGNDSLAIPNLNPAGNEILFLLMPKVSDGSRDVRIMRMPATGGPSQFVLKAKGIFHHKCAELPSSVCLYSPTEPGQQRFFSFDPVNGTSAEVESARMENIADQPNWSLSSDGTRLATLTLSPTQDAAIRILSLAEGSKKTIPIVGWPTLGSIEWAADGQSFWSGGSRSRGEEPENCAFVRINLDGTTKTMIEHSDVCFIAGIPSPDGRRLALEGSKAPSSNVWLLEKFLTPAQRIRYAFPLQKLSFNPNWMIRGSRALYTCPKCGSTRFVTTPS